MADTKLANVSNTQNKLCRQVLRKLHPLLDYAMQHAANKTPIWKLFGLRSGQGDGLASFERGVRTARDRDYRLLAREQCTLLEREISELEEDCRKAGTAAASEVCAVNKGSTIVCGCALKSRSRVG
jgi:hypothetical protein